LRAAHPNALTALPPMKIVKPESLLLRKINAASDLNA